jgi:hypothetical protein
MWYLFSTKDWLAEVVKSMNEGQLKPENSRFMMTFFTSMDYEFVEYFKTYKNQISAYSGKNFHIYTPFIFNGNLVSDDELQYMSEDIRKWGIPISNKPLFVFFNLQQRVDGSYEPVFFASFELTEFNNFNNKLKDIIYFSSQTQDKKTLEFKLMEIFNSRNLIDNNSIQPQLKELISYALPKNKIFISHSTLDKPFVRKLIAALAESDINFWIDEKEIGAGDDIQKSVSKSLKESKYLLVIISGNSVNSKWVSFELAQYMSFSEDQKIIPILIDKNQQFSEPIDNLLRRIKYLDFTDDSDWEINIEALKSVLKK